MTAPDTTPVDAARDILESLRNEPAYWKARLNFCQGELDAVRRERDEARAEVARLRAAIEAVLDYDCTYDGPAGDLLREALSDG